MGQRWAPMLGQNSTPVHIHCALNPVASKLPGPAGLDLEQVRVNWPLAVSRRSPGDRGERRDKVQPVQRAQRHGNRTSCLHAGTTLFCGTDISGCKEQCGLDHYQVRDWQAWHHHMTMLMLAMLYMLETRLTNKKAYQLLSCADIEGLLSHFLTRKDITEEEVLR